MAKLTPMMAQYQRIKAEYEDTILMFRLGDFYEMFFDDALVASEILEITLTSRDKTNKTPMCGVPYHAVDNYLSKLTKAGKKVALCDQVSEPTGKGIVEREVIRVVTPGTTFDENILERKANNYIACIVKTGDSFAFSFADVTTGEFKVTEGLDMKNLEAEITRTGPAEIICDEALMEALAGIFDRNKGIHKFPYNSSLDLIEHFGVKSLKVFGLEGKAAAVKAASSLMAYLKEMQKSDLQHINKINFYQISQFMILDESTIRNLELFFTSQGYKKEGSLFKTIDETVTAMGGRMLKKWLLHPLIDKAAIEKRLNLVEVFVKDSSLLREVRDLLSGIYDVERLLSRLSIGSGNARDLIAMKASLAVIPGLKALLKDPILEKLNSNLDPLKDLHDLIERAIEEESPVSVREGGMIKAGYDKELDELRKISTQGKTFIRELQEREIKRTGIANLKVKYNKVFGYHLEVSKSQLDKVPEDYIRKQTLVNAERFFIPELKEYEEKVLGAEDKIKQLEYEIFYKVRYEVVKEIVTLQKIATSLAALDCLTGLAFLAVRSHYSKPEILGDGRLEIVNGRHPVIERQSFSRDFVPNDCLMGESSNFLLITGPNMGGKSTYLRQVALIALMAQIGSYVPAESAKISVVDRIFTRVGASDNLARGESTFMVEMQEAAHILNNATEASLVILDELGRGTSTYDGVSIAWAVSEFIHDKLKAKTLFATHYHELIELVANLERANNLCVLVRENQQEGVVFLYKIAEGGVDKSYGIEVAKLAGLPKAVIGRAQKVLNELEEKHIQAADRNQMNLFMAQEYRGGGVKEESEAVSKLREVDINNLTPMQALAKLNELKNYVDN